MLYKVLTDKINLKMSKLNKKIFEDYLKYDGKHGNIIIPAIFSLIYKEKRRDPAYFEFLTSLVRRRAKSAYSKDTLLSTLKSIYEELIYERPDKWQKGWRITAHFFFVLSAVDHLGIKCLLPQEYESFVEEAIALAEPIYTAYTSGVINDSDWNVLPILQAAEDHDDSWFMFLSGCAFTWLVYKLF